MTRPNGKKERKKPLNIVVTSDIRAKIDAIADLHCISRSAVIEGAIERIYAEAVRRGDIPVSEDTEVDESQISFWRDGCI